MEGKIEAEKIDDVILPGFRFHPTDEELVGFYLKMKIQQRPLSIELIKQLDIYKYDPWDLPKFAATGEKECYFYCPRDRKYRNSTRPNRVTGAGFWKATGTDRPIYSSEGTKCIGLKKSLVFYKGRAARGIKTDWMMHEFRLPSAIDSATSKKSIIHKSLPANDLWAICRIFKKTNSMAQRALSHSWVSSLPEANMPDMHTQTSHCNQFSSENISCTTEAGSVIQFCFNNDLQQSSALGLPLLDVPPCKPVNSMNYKPSLLSISNGEHTTGFTFSPPEMSGPAMCTVDVAAMLLNSSPVTLGDTSRTTGNVDFSGTQQQCNSFSTTLQQGMQGNMSTGEDETGLRKNVTHIENQWGTFHSMGFPFSMPSNLPDEWKSTLPWDSPPCPSEISTSYSTDKCYS